jgi:hypothetical protein
MPSAEPTTPSEPSQRHGALTMRPSISARPVVGDLRGRGRPSALP